MGQLQGSRHTSSGPTTAVEKERTYFGGQLIFSATVPSALQCFLGFMKKTNNFRC
jgi:hypothetical protein